MKKKLLFCVLLIVITFAVVFIVLATVPAQVYKLPYSEYSKMVSPATRHWSFDVDPIPATTSDTFCVTLHPHIKIVFDNEVFFRSARWDIDKEFVHSVETRKGVVCNSTTEGFEFKKSGDFFESRPKTIDPRLYEVYLYCSITEVVEKLVNARVNDAYRYIIREYPSDSLMNREVIKEINTKVITIVNEWIENEYSVKISAIFLTISWS